MPVADPTDQQGQTDNKPDSRRAHLESLIQDWKAAKEALQNWRANGTARVGNPSEFNNRMETLKDKKRQATHDLEHFLDQHADEHPHLYQVAANHGYVSPNFPDERQGHPGTPGSSTPGSTAAAEGPSAYPNQQDNKGGGGGNGQGGGGGGQGGGGNQVNKADRLPGHIGKDYTVVKAPNGNVYVVYHVRGVPVAWRVPDKLQNHFGIDKSKAKDVTAQQFKNINVFGSIDDIELNGKHPIQNFFEQMHNQFGGMGMLKDKEVVSLLFKAYLTKMPASEILGSLKQTQWYSSKTQARIDWLQSGVGAKGGKLSAEQQQRVEGVLTQLRQQALDQFGPVDWQKTLDPAELDKWARKVASGAIGWDQNSVANKILKVAQNTEGTTAAAQKYQSDQQTRQIGNQVEDKFAAIRDDAIQWLGYQGKPSQDTLQHWAKDLASGVRSDADWQDYMRRQAQALYPWLAPDEKWQDRASSYKSQAEDIWGTPIGWDDPVLQDLTATKPDGTPIHKEAITAYDFAKKLRTDARYWNTPGAADTGSQLVSLLENKFMGVA